MKTGSRYNQLIDYLKGLNYDKYIWKLNELIKDPKLKYLLDESYGGYLSDEKVKFDIKDIATRKLVPCQNEIDMEKSLKYGLTHPEVIANYFKSPVVLNMPLVAYNGNFIIDGHHRWSQVYCFNPDAKMTCWNYEGDFSAMQMLKMMQAAIGSELGEIPVKKVDGINLLTASIDSIKDYIRLTADPKFYEEYAKYAKCDNDPETIIDIIASNCASMQSDNNCIKDAPERGLMPQTDQAPEVLEDIKEGVVVMSNKTRTYSLPKVVTSESNYYVDIDSDRIYVKIGEHDADHEDAPYEEYTYDFDKKEWDPSVPELPERIKKLISNYIKDTDVFSDKNFSNDFVTEYSKLIEGSGVTIEDYYKFIDNWNIRTSKDIDNLIKINSNKGSIFVPDMTFGDDVTISGDQVRDIIINLLSDSRIFKSFGEYEKFYSDDKSDDEKYHEAHERYKNQDYGKRAFSSDQEMISKLRDLNKVDITLIPDEVAYEEFKEVMINDYDFDTVELVENIMMEDNLYDSQINKLVTKSGLATDRIIGCCDHFLDFMSDQGVIE